MHGHDGRDLDVSDAEDLVGLVGLPANLTQGRDKQVAAVREHPVGVEPQPAPVLLGTMTSTPPGPMAKWSMFAWLPGWARSCRTVHPCRSSGARSRAVRRSPPAPRRQAWVSRLGWNRSIQAISAAAVRPARGPSWPLAWPARRPMLVAPMARTAADPPGQVVGPGGQLGGPAASVFGQGGGAGPADADPHPHRRPGDGPSGGRA